MKIYETEEAYSGKVSAISDDIVAIQQKVKERVFTFICHGKRVKRGLFKDLRLNKVFNADCNGAANILKAGAKLRKLTLGLKTFIYKLANPVKLSLLDLQSNSWVLTDRE